MATEETPEAKVEDRPEKEEPFVRSESTEYNLDTSSSVDELSKGILGLLEPAVEELNNRVNDVRLVVDLYNMQYISLVNQTLISAQDKRPRGKSALIPQAIPYSRG